MRAGLQAAIDRLADYPYSGPSTGKGDMRRAVANPYPYLIFYRVTTEGVTHPSRSSRSAPITRLPAGAII